MQSETARSWSRQAARSSPSTARRQRSRRSRAAPGVGIGTLYRHFPSRDALVEAIYAEHIGEIVALAEESAAAEDAWAGLTGFLERVLELQARNLPLRAMFLRQAGGSGIVAERRRQILPLLKRLVDRAREQGALRDDFTIADLSARDVVVRADLRGDLRDRPRRVAAQQQRAAREHQFGRM